MNLLAKENSTFTRNYIIKYQNSAFKRGFVSKFMLLYYIGINQ
ncbi:hypothetical protein LEP1GSC194_1638 [Leptospira alstonii serovar Sichuan str. 79601]|uniref:Uncharacterized protein n=1 Tax=Leptospira alstonii serovar Sichuan str. 79601 TaxID=1218565 RepID=M6CTA3_9LEPT|nr:hypothetical protein LEP1GSC194_1638 [Leptospira alstonii serovar Sichuan str. 79601]